MAYWYKKLRLLSLVSIFFISQMAFAADANTPSESIPSINDLFLTETVFPQEKNTFELLTEPGYFAGQGQTTTIIPAFLTYGITDNWEASISWIPYIVQHTNGSPAQEGSGDLDIGTKYSFLNIKKTNYHAAIGFNLFQPSGNINKGLTTGFRVYEPYAIGAKDFPNLNYAQVFTQLGLDVVERVRQPGENSMQASGVAVAGGNFSATTDQALPPADSVFLNTGFYVPFAGDFAFTTEVSWSNNCWNHGGKNNVLYAAPGLVWGYGKDWEIGLSTPIGFTQTSDHYQVLAIFSYSTPAI